MYMKCQLYTPLIATFVGPFFVLCCFLMYFFFEDMKGMETQNAPRNSTSYCHLEWAVNIRALLCNHSCSTPGLSIRNLMSYCRRVCVWKFI